MIYSNTIMVSVLHSLWSVRVIYFNAFLFQVLQRMFHSHFPYSLQMSPHVVKYACIFLSTKVSSEDTVASLRRLLGQNEGS